MDCRFCDRDDLTPQGHKSHETYCEENPNRGISYDKQAEMDLLDEKQEATEPERPNPDQSVSGTDSGLPSVETLSGGKSEPKPVTDGGEPSCPICEGDDVLDAGEQKEAYIGEVDHPNARAVLAYNLAEWTCADPDCAALWGDKYDEPLTMKEVVEA